MLGDGIDTLECLHNLGAQLELEGYGDHTHGEHPRLLGYTSHDGSGTGTRTTTHTGGDEYHLRTVLELLAYVLDILLCSLASHIGVIASTETLGRVATNLQFDGNLRLGQCLIVGIAQDE